MVPGEIGTKNYCLIVILKKVDKLILLYMVECLGIKPSPTITTQFFSYGTGRFGHPEQDRALSLREGSILQTFPRNYDFGRTLPFEILGRQIGNAVPPKLGEVIGKTIVRSLGIRNG